jgi:hypothetical protein
VIAKHGGPGILSAVSSFASTRFLRQTVVGQVAQQQQVGRLGNAREQRLKGALRRFGAVEIRQSRHANDSLGHSGRVDYKS